MTINPLFNIIISVVLAAEINALPFSTVNIHRQKPYENPKYVEGDMIYPPSFLKPTARGVLRRGSAVAWPNGIVPYEFLPGYGPSQEAFIVYVMEKMERKLAINNAACITFRPRIPSDPYYISFLNGEGCSSPVGQVGVEGINHTVSIQYPGCFDDARIMHELLHTLGFEHEQSRPDRDDYIKINFENIDPDAIHNFYKYDRSLANTQNTPYDYASVMHYEPNAFSSNGLPTIESLTPNVTFGQRYNISTIDILEVQMFYNCTPRGVTLPPIPTTTTANLYVENVTLSSSLTNSSEAFTYFFGQIATFYYQLFEVNVTVAGDYILKSDGSIDTFALLYKENFYPDALQVNLITGDNDNGGNLQFQLNIYLTSTTRYILVITTKTSETTGNFSLLISGLNRANLRQINSSSLISTTTPTVTSTMTRLTSKYSSVLTNNSLIYDRFGGSDKYYYEAIKISVSETGYYVFFTDSSIDTFGYLYSNSFDPLNVEKNLITGDDDLAENSQFGVVRLFQSTSTYILVVTTHNPLVQGTFTLSSEGPKEVQFMPVNTPSSSSTTTTTNSSASINFNTIMLHLHICMVFGYILHRFNTV